MREVTAVEMFGHQLRVYQDENAMCILQVDDLFFVGWANEEANLILPHSLLVTQNFDAAQDICRRAMAQR